MLEQLFKYEWALRKHLSAPMLREREAYLSELQARGLGFKRIQGVEYYLLRIIDALQIKDGCTHKFTWDEFYAGCQHCYSQSRYGMSEREKRCLLLDTFDWLDYTGLVDEHINKYSLYAEIFPRVDARLRQASYPLLGERIEYLAKCKSQHMALSTLKIVACYQIRIIELLNLTSIRTISCDEIETAAYRWSIESKCPSKRQDESEYSRTSFKHHAISWLSAIGCYHNENPLKSYSIYVDTYLSWMLREKGLSPQTIRNRKSHLITFFEYLTRNGLQLPTLTASDIDNFAVESCSPKHLSRHTISNRMAAVKGLLRFGGFKGWCKTDLYRCVQSPTIYQFENIPYHIPDSNIISILSKAANCEGKALKRNYAILLLLVLYGFRSGEVANLKLKDVDWCNEIIHIRHTKNYKQQDYPLLREVGDAIIDYLHNERRNEIGNEYLFIAAQYPYKKITNGIINHLVSKFTHQEDMVVKHRGPHSLRHSFATRMINSDKTIKEVADMLGHASTNTTMIYAKVDFNSLHSVSDMNWEGLL